MAPPTGYGLVFEDNFNTFDGTKWEVKGYDPNLDLICNTTDNIYVENGSMVARLKAGTCPGNSSKKYNCGLAVTKGAWKYGYFECRAKVAAGKGINNGIWTIGENWTWPPEIDIVETAGFDAVPDIIYMSYHWGQYPNNKFKTYEYKGSDYSLDYHIFGMEWTSTSVTWFIDGVERARATTNIPSIAQHMILSLGTGEQWGAGEPDVSSPRYAYFDYLRVYQKGVVTKYRCTGTPNYQCVEDPNGPYNSLAECQTACKPTTQKIFKVHITGPSRRPTGVLVIKSHRGDYTADEACKRACDILKNI